MRAGLLAFPCNQSSSPSQVMHARAGMSVFEGTVPGDSHLHARVTEESINRRSNREMRYSLRHTALTVSSSQRNTKVNKVFQ